MRNVSEWTSWLFVSLCLFDFTSPIPSFKNTNYFLYPLLPAWPTLSLHFFTLYCFRYQCLSTPVFLHTYPPILFTPPAAIQYGHGYLHIRQEEWNYLCKATWFCPSVIPVMFHCQLTQTMQSFTTVDILSLTCGLRQWYVLGPAQERTHWQRMISNICRVAPESCYKQMT